MTSGEKHLYLDFLQAKLSLLSGNPKTRAFFEAGLSNIRQSVSCRKDSFKHMESDMNEVLSPDDPDDKREIDRQLMERFGFTRIGADPAAVTRRVLKRGHFKTLEELEVVRTLIANQGNIETLGAVTYDQLALLLDTKEAEGME